MPSSPCASRCCTLVGSACHEVLPPALVDVRSGELVLGRLGLILSANAFISMVYFHTREQVQGQVVYLDTS